MPQVEMQTTDPTYASALVPAPSPTSSIGSRLPDDETDPEDARLTQEEFDTKCWRALRIDEPTTEETSTMRRPVHYAGQKMDPEHAAKVVPMIMQKLRAETKKLQDNELFEQAILKGSQVGQDSLTPTGDIDAIMQSMLEPDHPPGPKPNAGDNFGPSIMVNQSPFVPPSERDFANEFGLLMDELPSTSIRWMKGKNKRKA
ncbi:hypothetical protein BDM02DRAFT_3271470 [Thelephora ganbajun]|uniref:Uncharacterized protein n=1 Tax=Thelephora ganbajun TaxID=370292 RepID=A0ACB6Z7X1_THEGA|nr:hypothetical protein BDM02DRAFT_3271470 [Thelephora ganbajun]